MWEIIQAGGPFMWPIIFCSIASAAITLERLWTLTQKRVLPEGPHRTGLEMAERQPGQRQADHRARAEFAPGQGAGRRTRQPPPPARSHDRAPAGHRPARRSRARTLPEHAGHHRVDFAAAGTARHGHRHHQLVQCHLDRRAWAIRACCRPESPRPCSPPRRDCASRFRRCSRIASCGARSDRIVVQMEKEAMKLVEAIEAR